MKFGRAPATNTLRIAGMKRDQLTCETVHSWVVTEAGEDTVYLDRSKKLAVNDEVMQPDILTDLQLQKDDLQQVKAAER